MLEEMVDVLVRLGASFTFLTTVPCVGGDPNGLVDIRLDSGLNGGTFALAVGSIGLVGEGVVQLEEVSVRPAISVVVDPGGKGLAMVVLNAHEEEAIILFGGADLGPEGISPGRAAISPFTGEALGAPRVAHLDEPIASAESSNANNSVGVAVSETVRVGIIVVARAGGTGADHGMLGINCDQSVPKVIGGDLILGVLFPGAAEESAGSVMRQATNKMDVVTPVLGESLLNDGAPHGAVRARRSKHGATPASEGQVVVDHHSVGDSESVELDSVDAIVVQLVGCVHEDLLNSAFFLSSRSSGGHEPAVADGALVDIVERVATAEKFVVGEGILSSLPLSGFPAALALA